MFSLAVTSLWVPASRLLRLRLLLCLVLVSCVVLPLAHAEEDDSTEELTSALETALSGGVSMELPESSTASNTLTTTTTTSTSSPSVASVESAAASLATTETKEQLQTIMSSDASLKLSQELTSLMGSEDSSTITPLLDQNSTSAAVATNALTSWAQRLEASLTASSTVSTAAPDGTASGDATGDATGAGAALSAPIDTKLLRAQTATVQKRLAQRLEMIAKDSTLSDADKEQAQSTINQAQQLVTTYEDLWLAQDAFNRSLQQAPQQLTQLEQQLAQANHLFTQDPPAVTATDLTVVSDLFAELSAQLNTVQHEYNAAAATYNSLQSLPSRNQNQITRNNERIDEINKLLDSSAEQKLSLDEQMVLPFEALVLQKQNSLLQEEMRSLSLLQDIANYKLHIYTLHKDYLERYISQVRAQQAALSSQDMLLQHQEAATPQLEVIPQLKKELQTNQELTAYINSMLSDNAQMTKELQEVDAALTRLQQIEHNLQEQLSDLSGSVILSRLLNRQLGELPQIEISSNLDEVIPNLNLWMYDLRSYREQIFDVQSFVDSLLATNDEYVPYREQLVQLIRQRRSLCDELYNVMSDGLTIASELRAKYSQLQSKGQSVSTLINDHLFWLTSNQRISLDFFMLLVPSLQQQTQDLWHYLSTGFFNSENFVNYLKIFLPIALLGLIFQFARKFFRSLLNNLALRLDKNNDSYLLTPFALFNHFFLIIPRVALITIIGSIIIFITLDKFADQIALTYYLALHVICFLYMRHIMEPNSLEQRHFAVSPYTLARNRAIIDQIWYISIPMLTIANMREMEPTKVPNDSIGFVLMILGFLYLTIFALITVKRNLSRYVMSMPAFTLALVGILTPLTITIMLCLGYYYTVIQLLNRVAITLYLGFLYLILSQTIRRELYVAENKFMRSQRLLALQDELASFSLGGSGNSANLKRNNGQAQSLRAGQRVGANANNGAAAALVAARRQAGSNAANTVTPRGMTKLNLMRLELVSNRAFKLVNSVLLVVFLFFMYRQWSDLAGVLDYFNDIYLWQQTEVVDGKTITNSLSLGDVLMAIIILVVMVILNRNLPLLIERIFMMRSGLNAKSISYTVKLIVSYAITTLGVILAAGALGISWDNLQWLVAALSVGLGFGLQEIFGNFVSGIIILFERQLRVGDIITLNNLSGTVSKIRIRATTIISFENMEVVIPNKQFITSALTNWSLSNTVTKIEFTVGVAYDADVNKAKDLLRGIIRRCRDINREKKPLVYVKSLDASAITIMCEVYVNEIGKRKIVFDYLSTETLRLFGDNNIEIPYDRLDVTIRNLDTDKVIQFVAAEHGIKPESLSASPDAPASAAGNADQDADADVARESGDNVDVSSSGSAATSRDRERDDDDSMGSRLMRFFGVKS